MSILMKRQRVVGRVDAAIPVRDPDHARADKSFALEGPSDNLPSVKWIAVIIGALRLMACATTEMSVRSDVALVKARIRSIDEVFVGGQDDDEWWGPADVAVSVKATDVLIGRIGRPRFRIVLPMTAIPATRSARTIYILATRTEQGALQVVDWRYAHEDFCIRASVAEELRIERKMAELYRRGWLRCRL